MQPAWLAGFLAFINLFVFNMGHGLPAPTYNPNPTPPPIITPAPTPTPVPVPTPPVGNPTCIGTAPHPGDICWGGKWYINATYFGQPGPTNFTSANAAIDAQGKLHLKIAKVNGQWSGSQVQSEDSYGYGTYTWKVSSPVYFDPNIASGIFTYNENDPAFAHRELDAVEGAKWGNPADPTNAQFTVQPADVPGNLHRITAGNGPTTIKMTWKPGSVTFQFNDQTWVYTGTVPTPSAKVFMNMWLFNGNAPQNQQPAELVIDSFNFAAL